MSAAKHYAASQFPGNVGVCGWQAILPPRAVTQSLAETVTADVVVIGAGFAGLSAARRLHLLDPALRIVVLEAGIVGDGPAGRNSGFIIDLPHEVSSEEFGGDSLQKSRDHIALQRRAVTFATELAAEAGWGAEILDNCGRYNLAVTPQGDAHLRDYAKQLVRLGEAHDWFDAKAVAELTGSPSYSSGLFMPGAAMVQPAAYIRGLADSLKAPVRLYERTPAVSFERTSGGWRVATPNGAVDCARIVLANNGYAERFGFFRGLLMHVFTYASLSEPFDPARLGGKRTWAATPASPMGTTIRRIAGATGDRMLVRFRYTYNPSLVVGADTLRRAGERHDKTFAQRFPSLAGVRMEYRWGGAMALTWNAVPAFGEVDEGVFAACGCNGLGASNATASGLAAAEIMLGAESELTRIYRAFAPPRPLPPPPLAIIGIRSTLALREWKAGAE